MCFVTHLYLFLARAGKSFLMRFLGNYFQLHNYICFNANTDRARMTEARSQAKGTTSEPTNLGAGDILHHLLKDA